MDKSTIESYPRYDSYKDSGYDWIGQVPSNWKDIPNKYVFNIINNKVGKKSDNYVLLSLTLQGIIKRDMINAQGKFPAEFDTYQEVKKNDFVFCLFDVEETPRTVGLSDYDGMITGAYTVFRAYSHFDERFIYYYYLNLDLDKRFKPLYRGLRNTIPKDWFMSFKTYFPNKMEQTGIAKFLDEKTLKIDKAIELKQQQIKKLEEYKQIVIQNAVTKGLNPDVTMKDSGVDWIGEIPEHWEVVSLKHLLKFHTGGTPESGNDEYYDGNLPWVTISNLDGRLTNRTNTISLRGVRNANIPLTPKGSLLYSFKLSVGQVAFAHKDLYTNEAIATFLSAPDLDLEFYYYSLPLFVIHNANTNIYGAKLLNQNLIKNADILKVPKDEQRSISRFLDEKVSEIKCLTDCNKAQINRLKEFKTVLINAAVTGKIKVA